MAEQFTGFPKATLKFLNGLQKDNSKKWFDAHRGDYDEHLIEPAKAFVASVGKHLKKISKDVRIEPKVNGSIKRMNRDVRFSKDKSPYKSHLDFGFKCGAKDDPRPSFFMRITPKLVCVGLGLYQFEKKTLAAYRAAVDDSRRGTALKKALDGVLKIKGYTMTEPAYKKVPRGMDPDHVRADLLKLDALYVFIEAKSLKELHTAKLVDWAAAQWKTQSPVFKWLDKLS